MPASKLQPHLCTLALPSCSWFNRPPLCGLGGCHFMHLAGREHQAAWDSCILLIEVWQGGTLAVLCCAALWICAALPRCPTRQPPPSSTVCIQAPMHFPSATPTFAPGTAPPSPPLPQHLWGMYETPRLVDGDALSYGTAQRYGYKFSRYAAKPGEHQHSTSPASLPPRCAPAICCALSTRCYRAAMSTTCPQGRLLLRVPGQPQR